MSKANQGSLLLVEYFHNPAAELVCLILLGGALVLDAADSPIAKASNYEQRQKKDGEELEKYFRLQAQTENLREFVSVVSGQSSVVSGPWLTVPIVTTTDN